jgi:hypothetical protein
MIMTHGKAPEIPQRHRGHATRANYICWLRAGDMAHHKRLQFAVMTHMRAKERGQIKALTLKFRAFYRAYSLRFVMAASAEAKIST